MTAASESPHVQRAVDDLRVTEVRLKKRKLDRDIEEVEDFFRERQQKTATETANALRARKAAADAQKTLEWEHLWQAYGLGRIPADAPPDSRIELHSSVAAVLRQIGIDQPREVVQQLVDAAVQKVLDPYHNRKRVEQIISDALSRLPYNARGAGTPTAWEIKGRKAARHAIATLGDQATDPEMCSVSAAAVQSIAWEYEDARVRDSIIEELRFWMLGEAETTDREHAMDIAKRTLAKLPPGASRVALENAIDTALLPLQKSIQNRRELAARKQRANTLANSHLHYVDDYLRREYEFANLTEKWRAAEQLKVELRPLIIRELEKGRLTEDRIREYIECIVDRRL